MQQKNLTNICLRSFFTHRSHPLPPHLVLPLSSRQKTSNNMATSEKRPTHGRLRSSTRPNLDAHEIGRARSRSRDSRHAEPPEAGSGDDTEDVAPHHYSDSSTKTVDSPAPEERHQLTPPRSPGHHHRHLGSPRTTECDPQSSGDRCAHACPLDYANTAARIQRVLDDGNQIILGHEARRRRFDQHIEQAKTPAREASLVVKRAQQALTQSVASAMAEAAAALSPSTRPQTVASRRPQPGHAAFFKGGVACMTASARIEFSAALATAVVNTACALLTSERPASRQADTLSVEAAGTRMNCTPIARQTRDAPTLTLVRALRMAHDEAPTPPSRRTLEIELAERSKRIQRRSDSRDRGDGNRGGGGNNGWGGDHHNSCGGGSDGGGGGGTSGARVAQAAAENATLVQQPGQCPQLWQRQLKGEERREMTVGVGRVVNFLLLVFVLEHRRPKRGDRGDGQWASRVMAGEASGPKACTLMVRLLITHFNGVDREEGYTKLNTFGMCNGTTFSDFGREFRVLVPTATWSERVLSRGRMWCWRWFGWRRMSTFWLSCLRCTLVRTQRTRGHTPRWMLYGD